MTMLYRLDNWITLASPSIGEIKQPDTWGNIYVRLGGWFSVQLEQYACLVLCLVLAVLLIRNLA